MVYFFCYNRIMTTLLKNVFSDKEITLLYKAMACFAGQGHEVRESGRYIVASTQFLDIPGFGDLLNKIETLCGEATNRKLKSATSGFHLYKRAHGDPFLPPHIDDYVGEVVFDYQLDSTIDWPVKVNKELYHLKDNDAVVFEGETVPHSRPENNFVGLEYVLMFIVNMYGENHWFNNSNVNPKTKEEIAKEIQTIREDKENW